jgi:RecA-family ATPase
MDNFDNEIIKNLPDFTVIKTDENDELKCTYSFAELWEKKDEEQKFLIPELLPAQTVAVLIGEDGIGKTQITTQLCLQIALGHKSFMGMDLNAEHKRCLIVATEESRQKFTSAIVKQAINLEKVIKPNDIKISFTEGSNFDEWPSLRVEIEKLLTADKHDLIVIDALSDLFTLIDGEINSNSDARKILSSMQSIATKHEVTILLIHHAAKTKLVQKKKEGKMFVEKTDSQGAGAITQKPRTILALTNDPGSISDDGKSYTNYLHVVKANLMSKHYMSNALQCIFDSNSLLHSYVCLTDIEMFENPENQEDQYQKGRENSKKADPLNVEDSEHERRVLLVFAEQEYFDRAQLVEKLRFLYNVGKNKIESKDGVLSVLLSKKYISNNAGQFTCKIKPAEKLKGSDNTDLIKDTDEPAPF